MKWQVLLAVILIGFGNTLCHYVDADGDIDNDYKRNDEIDKNYEFKSEKDDDSRAINENLLKKPVGQHKGDHLDHDDIMFRKGEEEAEFGKKSSSDEELSKGSEDATIYAHKRWTLPVPYQIERSLGSTARSAISKAIAEYSLKTCITFREKRFGDTSYLSLFKGEGCWSYVGRSGGEQRVSLGSGCEHKMVAIHEIMHALGFWHEQSRTDRDNYVRILSHNVKYGYKHNFNKKLKKDVTTFGLPYDYRSVMHYRKTEFGKYIHGKKQQTIVARNNPNQKLGQCSSCGMSETDADQLNAMYCSLPINRRILRRQMARLLANHAGQSNKHFSYTVLNLLKKIYPKYNFLVNAYNAVAGYAEHAYIGYCVHIFRSHRKNLVVCYSKKTFRFSSRARQIQIASAALASITKKNCNAKWARDTAWRKAISFGYPVAAIEVVRFGYALRSTWNGPGYFKNFKCHKCTGWWWGKRCTNNHYSSFVILFE
ncbi:zinc metalloproteinase nas-36-like isoform X2 [Hydractinia symbiolongicarpus]|uniref:zinc metalloproteinase nas-36-like isoform X2 n=1 Tax=Hydractinia symbiolongicarpus TaxID=13093 RepID=UPI00254B0CCB|nr:zinc metalloproteinase nas-36-like isoform X2 [Hydractinia symbiolongicarpus]